MIANEVRTYPDRQGKRFYRRRLPHWEVGGATYFVTYRLAGSLPVEVVADLRDRFAGHLNLARQIVDPLRRKAEELAAEEELYDLMDRYLGEGHGPTYLADPRVASLVAENLLFHAGQRYDLHQWVIMPNHVHLVLTPSARSDGQTWSLRQIVHGLKSYTAHSAKHIVSCRSFWQHEYFDRLIRDEADFMARAHYVENNPVVAELCRRPSDWRWSSAYSGDPLAE